MDALKASKKEFEKENEEWEKQSSKTNKVINEIKDYLKEKGFL